MRLGSALLILLLTANAFAEPEISQFFPSQKTLLGRPLLWIIEIRHPLWESYSLTIKPLAGAEIKIVDHQVSQKNGRVHSRYRVQIVPESLVIPDTPSILISDEKGQNIVLAGKAISVESISGSSLDILEPAPPSFQTQRPDTDRARILLLLLLAAVLIFSLIRMFYLKSPRRRLLRNLRKVHHEVRENRYPSQIGELLRSELLWGFAAGACTPLELKEMSGTSSSLRKIADALHSVECYRYSGKGSPYGQMSLLRDSVTTAIRLLQSSSGIWKRIAGKRS